MSAITMKKSPAGCFKILIEAILMLMACLVLQVMDLQLVCAEKAASCIERERRALLHFKAALLDHNDMLSSWGTEDHLSSNCCQWKGVTCNNLTGHVQLLDLPGSYGEHEPYLSGDINTCTSLVGLQQLQYLDLSFNKFEESHIPEFFGSMSNLRYLDLSNCDFVGKIPSRLGSLSHLEYLNLGWNCLEGSIPHQLGNLSKLQYLDLDVTYLQGTIPSQLGNLSSLRQLYLGPCYDDFALKIDGKGEWLSTLTSLTHLHLSSVLNLNTTHNWLQIGKLPKLRELVLVDCSLSDDFILSLYPFKFNFSTSLSVLDLSLNTFTSPKIFQLVSNVSLNLVELDLSRNLFEGSTSKDFGSTMISHRSSHVLHENNFQSWVEIMISKLQKLRKLWLYNCNLSDYFLVSLTHSKFNFSTSLSILDLSWNSFMSFKIFQWVSNISPNLVELDLSRNLLEGNGSSHFGSMMDSLVWLDLFGNRLKGGDLKSFVNMCTLHSLCVGGNNLTEDLASIVHNFSVGCARHSLQELDLSHNQITGTLPNLPIFPSLKTLDLSRNRLSGKIYEGTKLAPKLESLLIQSNSLEGGIPMSFGKTCTLGLLDLSNNNLSMELPTIVHHLSGCARYSLKELYLGMNQIVGTLPDFSIFSSLKVLSLLENRLNGKIVEDIQFPPQLETLDVGSNCLEGVITESYFANNSKLRELDLTDNSLALEFSQNWAPPFQLEYVRLRSCLLGPAFPRWLQTQNKFRTLDISNARILDIVPDWFWGKLLPKFSVINISYNNLRGNIPNFPARKSYYYLNLASNRFEGPIPPFLRGAISLDLSKNKFSDSHSFICSNGTVETLGYLDLSNNQLSRQIPDCWSYFESLSYLDLSHNSFSGKIPASMGSLLEIQVLLLRNNSLSEEIPASMKSCTKLSMLDMRENELSGQIPSWIGSKLQDLQILSLQKNRFFGSLPLQLCYLQSVQLLDISFNNLSGQIPKCINNFTSMAQMTFSSEFSSHVYYVNTSSSQWFTNYDLNALLMWKGVEQMFKNNGLSLLKSIDLSSNQLSGEIPIEIENLLGLISLNLSRNNLTGEIPSNIGRLTSLEFIDLSRNQLIGLIPSSLTQIDRLTMLDVSHNHLSGEIPTGTQLQSFSASSYEDNPGLCGKPLEKLCIIGEPPKEPTVKFREDEHLAFAHAFYMSMAFGFAVGFWGIFGSILVKRSWRHAYFRFLNNLVDHIYVMVTLKVAKYKRWLKG